MDSGNSGSIQSSSGGDEEFESRTERFSSFLNSSTHGGVMSSNPQPPSQHHNHSSSLFDPLTSYLEVFSRSTPSPTPNSLPNLDIVWPRTQRSEPNCTQTSGIIGSSPTSSAQLDRIPFPNPSTSTDPIRSTKKRSRASRRAPTTVLTTDTSNFRAMVQEFTGIPAPPFSASPFTRSRFDLFNSTSTLRSGHLEPPPPPLLRPFAQKVQQPPFVSSTMIDAIASSTNNTTTTTTIPTNASNSTSTNNYQLPSELGLHRQSPNLLNMENPMLTFQSLLQSPPNKYPFVAKSQAPPSIDSRLKVRVLEEFGTSHGHVNANVGGLPNMGNSDGDQNHLRSFNGNYGNSQRVSSCKMNFSTSSSDFHADKGSENVSSRGEGMVDSWICSSD